MLKSTRNNRYKYNTGDVAWVIYDEKFVDEVTILKRLKRPYRLSDNFYFCTWVRKGVQYKGIKYEEEMYKNWDAAMTAIEKQLAENF